MPNQIHRRYFLLLLFPLAIVLSLCMWMTLYSHNSSIRNMQRDAEENMIRAAENLSGSIENIFHHTGLSALNIASQAAMINTVDAEYLAQYVISIDNTLLTMVNNECILNDMIDRAYIFMFDKNRVINQTSALNQADLLYNEYLKIDNLEYNEFVDHFTSRYYHGEILADVPLTYHASSYSSWMMVQTVPLNPTKTPTGLIVFMLDEYTILNHLRTNLADENSISILLSENGKRLISQGSNLIWTDESTDQLLSFSASLEDGFGYYEDESGKEYLVASANAQFGNLICAQPVDTAFSGIHRYNISILLIGFGMISLAVIIAAYFTNKHARAMKRVLNTISPEHRSESARNVFSYMQEAIINAQEHEALLSAHASHQMHMLKSIFVKRLLKGEWQSESDLLKDEANAGMNLEAAYYHVLMVHFRERILTSFVFQALGEILNAEFGENAFLVQMDDENIACLLLCEESDVTESIEALAEDFSARFPVITLAASAATDRISISRAYRQVRMMSRMVYANDCILKWYSDLFQDDVLYNSEYSFYSETALRNNILSGNSETTLALLNDLYDKSLHGSVNSDHVLRFFACDLYRLVHHLAAPSSSPDKKASLAGFQLLLDRVMENPCCFDSLFEEVKSCLMTLCEESKSKRGNANDETLGRITAYIDEHFRDPELSVTSIADALGLSVKYLSLFFKEQTNKKISAYIENKRISYACSLLETTEMSINDISLASGYALTHTFRVAFKKIQGVTPLEWKKTRSNT